MGTVQAEFYTATGAELDVSFSPPFASAWKVLNIFYQRDANDVLDITIEVIYGGVTFTFLAITATVDLSFTFPFLDRSRLELPPNAKIRFVTSGILAANHSLLLTWDGTN